MHEMDYSAFNDAQGSGKEDKGEFDEYAIILSDGVPQTMLSNDLDRTLTRLFDKKTERHDSSTC